MTVQNSITKFPSWSHLIHLKLADKQTSAHACYKANGYFVMNFNLPSTLACNDPMTKKQEIFATVTFYVRLPIEDI